MNIVSNGQLKAQSISIQVSDRTKCNAGCLFCISRTTPGNNNGNSVCRECDFKKLSTGLRVAERMGATHAILTGKSDPTQEGINYLADVTKIAAKHIPIVDMHTNGLVLQKVPGNLYYLKDAGLNMITFSIASFDSQINKKLMGVVQDSENLIREANKHSLLVRCSLVVNKSGVKNVEEIMKYIQVAGNAGAHMVVIREVWVPEVFKGHNHEVYEWNKQNKIDLTEIEYQFNLISQRPNGYRLCARDPLPWGTSVYAVGGIFDDPDHGVNITFAKCDQATSGPVIKSIVHKPNGHGYRNWDHHGDILY